MKFPFSEEVLNIRISKYDILQKVILLIIHVNSLISNHHHTILPIIIVVLLHIILESRNFFCPHFAVQYVKK